MVKRKGSQPPPTPLEELRRNLEALGLFAVLEGLDAALEHAQALHQGYVTFLAGLVDKELLWRTEQAAQKRRKAACFPETKTFDTFDWDFQKEGLNVQLVKDLMNLDFVRQGRPVLLLGKPGTGKSHIAVAYGHLAVLAGHSVRFTSVSKLLTDLYAALAEENGLARTIGRLRRIDLLVLDDLRRVPPKPEYASLLFDVIEARHNRKATILSSNLRVADWGEVLGDVTLTASLVDRLMERAHIINIKPGRSYRSDGPEAPPDQDRPADLQHRATASAGVPAALDVPPQDGRS
jgi:DNA replication protein DnaC